MRNCVTLEGMNITLQLSPADQAELEKRAAATGRDVGAYILDAVYQQLATDENGAAHETVPYAEWHRKFRDWIAGHRSRNPRFDDSRESIYD
jgi:hypothetical protein